MHPYSRVDGDNLDLHVIRARGSRMDRRADAAAAAALGRLFPLLCDPDVWRRVDDIPRPRPVGNLGAPDTDRL